MRLLALDDSTVDANFRWIIATHLQIFEQIVCGTPVSKADQPGMDEGEAVLHRAIATPVPSRMRSVCCATAASSTKGSSVGSVSSSDTKNERKPRLHPPRKLQRPYDG